MVQFNLSICRGLSSASAALPLIALWIASACSASPNSTFGGDSSAGGSSASGDSSSSTSSGLSGSGGDPFGDGLGGSTGTGNSNQDDCSDAAKLIYMIGEGRNLYSFSPPTNEVKNIGVIDCPQQGFASPFSMAVDRRGIAWVVFSDGQLFNVDTATASCTRTEYRPGQQGYTRFGMGFVSNTAGSQDESLYVSNYEGTSIAKLDTQALTINVVGTYDLLHSPCELTGTGNAQLFGFFSLDQQSVVIAELDKSNAHILSQAPQPTIQIGLGWAFAFWGGDFYLFTDPTGSGSQIDRYQPSNGITGTVLTDIGDTIVGAGVSTCAPVETPR